MSDLGNEFLARRERHLQDVVNEVLGAAIHGLGMQQYVKSSRTDSEGVRSSWLGHLATHWLGPVGRTPSRRSSKTAALIEALPM